MSITAEELANYLGMLPEGAGVKAAALVRSLERIRVKGERVRRTPVVDDDFPRILLDFDEALDAHRKEFGS